MQEYRFSVGATKSPLNTPQMAKNARVAFYEQVEYACEQPRQCHIFDDKLITSRSMYGHFPYKGLTRGHIRDQRIQQNVKCRFYKKHTILHDECSCMDTVFCQDRPARIQHSAWIFISLSARKGCERFCPDVCLFLDARIDLPGYFQDTIHHPVHWWNALLGSS
jgi:hypothetical protein